MNKYCDPHEDPNYVDVFTVGTIKFETNILDTLIEGQVGPKARIPKIGECKIEIYGNEGSIPHFHIFNTNKSFETCICIYSNNYFVHGKYKDTLNEKQVNQLANWLKSPNDKNNKITNWEAVELAWDFANRECKFPDNKKKGMPDYTKLNDTAKVY